MKECITLGARKKPDLHLFQQTAAQAMVRMRDDQSLDNGFTLTLSLAEIHVPRMIRENHPADSGNQVWKIRQ